jgi:hypothetical protein
MPATSDIAVLPKPATREIATNRRPFMVPMLQS